MTMRDEVEALLNQASYVVEDLRRDPSPNIPFEEQIRRATTDENIAALTRAVLLLADRVDRLEK